LVSSSYIVDIHNLSDEYLANYFFPLCKLTLYSVDFFFHCESIQFFIQHNPICQILFFFPRLLEHYSERPYLYLYLEVFTLYFPLVVLNFQILY
jgi:hypothetical protein